MKLSLGQYMEQTGCDVETAMYAFLAWYLFDEGQLYLNCYTKDEQFIERREWKRGFEGLPEDTRYSYEFEFDSKQA